MLRDAALGGAERKSVGCGADRDRPEVLMKCRTSILCAAFALATCSLVGFAADAPTAPSASASGVKRTIVRRTDVPNSPYEVVYVLVEVPANTSTGRHTHPGSVMGYVMEGSYTMMIEGRPPLLLKEGESLEVPAAAIHDERSGSTPAKLLAVFTVEKGKPLTTPAK
jgi:quercetin dioxygenase-like cupin family protein